MSTTKKIQWIITFLLPICLYFYIGTTSIAYELKMFFVCTRFVILIMAFDFFHMLVPAIMLPGLYLLFNVAPVSTVYSPWTGTTIWMILGATVLSNVMEDTGLLRRIALICIKTLGGSFRGVLWGVLIAGIIANIVTFCNSWIIVIALIVGVCKSMDYKPGSKEAILLMLVLELVVCGATIPVFSPIQIGIINNGAQAVLPDFAIQWFHTYLYAAPMFLFMAIILIVWMKMLNAKQLGGSGEKEYFEQELQRMGKMSIEEKKTAFITLLLVLFLLTNPIHGIDVAYAFLILPLLLFFPGINVGKKQALDRINISLFAFIGTCMAIGTVGSAVGMSSLITTTLVPLLEGKSTIVVLYVILIIGMFVNFLMTPAGLNACLSTPVTQISMDLGINPMAPLLTMFMGMDQVFLPYEVTSILLVFSYGFISMKDFIKYNLIKTVLYFVFFGLIQIPFWKLLGLI